MYSVRKVRRRKKSCCACVYRFGKYKGKYTSTPEPVLNEEKKKEKKKEEEEEEKGAEVEEKEGGAEEKEKEDAKKAEEEKEKVLPRMRTLKGKDFILRTRTSRKIYILYGFITLKVLLSL